MDDDASANLKQALYTAVGFGILGVQQVQLRRRQLQRDLVRLAVDLDAKVEPVLDDLEARLPDDVRPLLAEARSVARSARRSLLGT